MTEDKNFVANFGSIQGEKNKKIQKEYESDALVQPLLYNKQFYYWKELPASLITSDELLKTIVENFKSAKNMNKFFRKAME